MSDQEWRLWRARVCSYHRNKRRAIRDALSTLSVREQSRVRAAQGETSTVAISLPFLPNAIALRPSTTDLDVLYQIFMEGQYDFPYLHTASVETIVDVGAHIGLASMFFAMLFPHSRIIAIEPEPLNFQLLRLNTAQYRNITPIQVALHDKEGRVSLVNPTNTTWGARITDASEEGEVRSCNPSDLFTLTGSEAIDLVKLDIEGAERNIFANYQPAWLRNVGAVIIELHDSIVPGCSQAFYRALYNIDFDKQIRGDAELVSLCVPGRHKAGGL